MSKQQIIIFILVGVMGFSALGTTAYLIIDQANKDDSTTENQQNSEDTTVNSDLEVPEAYIPEGDVTKLVIEDLKEGDGAEVKAGDIVTLHYHGTLAKDGTVFDSSFERGTPITFGLDNLIPGWQEGIPGMKVGGRRRLVIPSELGYGEVGSPPAIGPNADLVFEIELFDTKSE